MVRLHDDPPMKARKDIPFGLARRRPLAVNQRALKGGEVRILGTEPTWRRGRVAYYTCLENKRSERAREFESHRLRHKRKKEYGVVAQLGERPPCKREVVGSMPIDSTNT